MQQIYHFSMQELISVQSKLNNKKGLERLAKSFVYDEELSMKDNLENLSSQVISYFQVKGKAARVFQKYFIERNMPIQVNLQPLKYEQLYNIIQDCISLHSQNSTVLQRNQTYTFRNILLKRILIQQKQAIDDYFSTLNEKSMLKAVDIYPLFTDIFNQYFLYQLDNDVQMFFDKINSFNIFINLVNKYIQSEKRLSFISSNEKYIEYIRRSQFQWLLQFWQIQNPQLKIYTEKRVNITQTGIQTDQIQVSQNYSQTQRIDKSLLYFINNALQNLNLITIDNNNYQELQSIEKIYQVLRKEKLNVFNKEHGSPFPKHPNIDVLQYFAQKTQKTQKISAFRKQSFEQIQSKQPMSHKSFLVNKLNNEQTILHKNYSIKQLFQDKSKLSQSRSKSKNKIQNDKSILQRLVSKIYSHYYEIQGFNINILSKFLIDLGVMQHANYTIIVSLLKNNLICDQKYISTDELNHIIDFLMKKDQELTLKVIEQFVKFKIDYDISASKFNVKSQIFNNSRTNLNSYKSGISTTRNYKGKYLNMTYY